jgi:hypothetical protein
VCWFWLVTVIAACNPLPTELEGSRETWQCELHSRVTGPPSPCQLLPCVSRDGSFYLRTEDALTPSPLPPVIAVEQICVLTLPCLFCFIVCVYSFILFFPSGAGEGTQSLLHARQGFDPQPDSAMLLMLACDLPATWWHWDQMRHHLMCFANSNRSHRCNLLHMIPQLLHRFSTVTFLSRIYLFICPFKDRVSLDVPGWPWTHDLPDLASAGITGAPHCIQPPLVTFDKMSTPVMAATHWAIILKILIKI